MSERREKKRKRSLKSRLIGLLLIAAIILGAGYYYRAVIIDVVESLPFTSGADRLNYIGHTQKRFATIGTNLVVGSSKGVQVISKANKKLLTESFEIMSPGLETDGAYGIIYDIGGKIAKVFDKNAVLYTAESETAIISADVSERGTAVLAQDAEGYNGMVSFYAKSGNLQMQWFSGEAYIMNVKLSPNGKTIAALGITKEGSRIIFLDASSGDEIGVYKADGEILIDIAFKSNSKVSAVGKTKLVSVKKDGSEAGSYSYDGKVLRRHEFGKSFDILLLSDYQVGDFYSLVTMNGHREIKKAEVTGNVSAISIKGWNAAVYSDRSITVYSRSCDVKKTYENRLGLEGVIYIGGKIAALGSYYAEILK